MNTMISGRRMIRKKDIIKLPIKADGTPDFAYIESYIQKTRTIAMERISILQSL